MNTKQAEELTGISRQNIRYYERQGLLEPVREDGNAYRDYSDEDIRRLKLIKMLRLLDMPIKEIEQVLKDETLLKEAAARQQELLQKQQKQLRAAIEVCASIHKEHGETVDVDGYLEKMEHMSQNGGMFAKIVDDYKQVAQEEEQRQISFYAGQTVNTSGEFEEVLRKYAAQQHRKFRLTKGGMYPEFTLDGVTYTAARLIENGATKIVCKRENRTAEQKEISVGRRKVFQGMHLILVNMRRHRGKSVLNVLVSMFVVIVVAFYMGNVSSVGRQLDELPEKLPVTGQVWNRCGQLSSGLFIPQKTVDAVYKSRYVKDIAESSELIGRLAGGEVTESQTEQRWQYQLWGMNRLECIDGLEKENITWAKDWDWKRFQKSEGVVLVSEQFLADNQLNTGGEVTFSLARYQQDISGISVTIQELLPASAVIVGSVDLKELRAEQTVPDVIFPLEEVKRLYERKRMVYNTSALSFRVSNPMSLNALKKEMKDAGLQSIDPTAERNYTGAGLKLSDTIFIQTVTSLEKSLSLMKGFLPFVLLVVLMLGYIVPHLLFQGRREEYAIMRALGTGRGQCSLLFFAEHILLAAAGSAAGVLAGMAAGAVDVRGGLAVWAGFLMCYGSGAAAALWMFGRFSVAAVLSHRD